MSPEEAPIGTAVRLKHQPDSPVLTVFAWINGHTAECTWWKSNDLDQDFETLWFPAETLEVVEE